MQQSTEEIYRASAAAGLRPEPLLTISQWANEYRVLSQRASAEPGPWRTERTPYLKEIMDCLSASSAIERVVFMKGAQVGATEAGNNWIGYVIHHAPGPMMAVQPTVETAKRNSKQRIDPLIEESEILRELVRDPRSRDSGNTILSKEFPGGVLVMTGANSAVGLRSMASRYLFLDEVDGYPGDVEGEGDPVNLALARTRTFARRKVFLCSTPKIKGASRIETAYEESDQRQYWVPCPECREYQLLKFVQIRWPKGHPEQAVYVCEHCGAELQNHQKQWMLPRGEWRASAAGDGRTAGFHLSSLYSPVGWFSWTDVAAQFEQAQNNPPLLQVFVNTVLGETWREVAEEPPDSEKLWLRAQLTPRPEPLPDEVLFVTAGVDVQADRLEVQTRGWGRGQQSWLISYDVVSGRPTDRGAWESLDSVLARTFRHAAGIDMPVLRVAIDSGYAAQEVYGWARRQRPGWVVVTKGYDAGVALLAQPKVADVMKSGKRLRRGVKVWPVNVSMMKSELYGWLKQEPPAQGDAFPAGWLHDYDAGQEYFEQLTSEVFQFRIVHGFRKGEWIKKRERNEALDTFGECRAAAEHVGISRFSERDWRAMERHLFPEERTTVRRDAEPEALYIPTATPEPPKPQGTRRPRVIRSPYL